jgi:flavodoxin I
MVKNKMSIIYGSDTGITDYITTLLVNKLDRKNIDVIEVFTIKPKDFLKYDIILIGVPTWYVGDLQSDWEDFLPEFKKIDFTGIKVAFYGLGDQYGYPDNFVDGIGILAKVVLENGGEIFGYWPNVGYEFNESIGLAPNGMFYGLAIDEDNQQEYTEERLDKWVKQIKKEINL